MRKNIQGTGFIITSERKLSVSGEFEKMRLLEFADVKFWEYCQKSGGDKTCLKTLT